MISSLPPGSEGPAAPVNGRTVQEGDMVVVYENPNSMKAVYINSKDRYDNRFGSFAHKDWIGLPYGSKVFSRTGCKGWVYLISPTPELWSQVLRHRTQILYVADISMAVTYLDLRPGSVVLESGTGSGSLTHSLIRAVAPTGHVHTFEFHAERAAEASKEFARHGLSSCVTVKQRNIELLGFPRGGPEEEPGMIDLTGQADAVFLDLPAPHKAVASAGVCLKPDGRFCSFSPCIEQVQKTCEELERNGFTDLQTLECLLRVHEVRTEQLVQVGAPDADVDTSAAPPDAAKPGEKRARDESSNVQGVNGDVQGVGGQVQGTGGEQEGSTPGALEDEGLNERAGKAARTGGDKGRGGGRVGRGGRGGQHQDRKRHVTYTNMVTSKPAVDARGHTGYLIFARKFVVGAAGDANGAGASASNGATTAVTPEATADKA